MRISTLCLTALLSAFTSTLSAQPQAAGDLTMKAQFTEPAALAAPQNVRFRAAKHPIDEQPDGELRIYEMATYYYSQNMDEWVHRYGQRTQVVFDGDDVYIQNIINTHTYGSWIRGEISADRKHIVFDNFQPYVEQGDYTYYVSLAYADEQGVYWGDTESDDFQFDYDEATGVITNPNLELTLASDEGGANTLNSGYELIPFTAELVQLPAHITEADIQPYSLRWDSNDPYYFPLMAYVAQDGDDFYIKGFSTKNPESWVKGTLNAAKDSVILNNGQYVGLYDGLYFLYMKGASYSGLDSDGWPIYKNKDHAALKWNPDDRSLYGPDGILFVLGQQLRGGYSQSVPSQDMKPFYGVAAKPKTPEIRNFDIDTQFHQVQSSIMYVVPVEDVDGNFINPDSLYYRFYLDGEQLHFANGKGEYYQHFPDEWEVPSRFTDRGKVNGRTDNANGTMTYHVLAIDKDLRPKTISLQSVYRMNGTVTYSDICHYDTETKTTTVETVTGIKDVLTASPVAERLYDLQGRALSHDRKGLVIRSQRMADGSVKNVKMLR